MEITKKYKIVVTGYVGVGAKEKEGDVVASFNSMREVKEFAIKNFQKFYYHVYVVKTQDGVLPCVISTQKMYELMKAGVAK